MRIGVVGLGLRGGLAGLANQPERDIHLCAAADLDEEALTRFREKRGADAFITPDYRAFAEQQLDAVFVLSPDYLHEEHACFFLEAGIAVYLEKPIAITIEGADRILETAKRTRAKLYLGHNMRHFGVVTKMKEWIDAGYIGEVKTAWCRHFVSYGGDAYFCDWHAERAKATGLLLQKGSHDIDVLHWLCGGYTESVTALGSLMVYGDNPNRRQAGETWKVQFRSIWPPQSLDHLNPTVDVEDVSLMLMRLDNGVLASYQQCHFTPDAWRNYTVIGESGRIENFGDSPGSATIRLWDHYTHGPQEHGDLEYRVPQVAGGHGGSDTRIVEEFLRFITEGGATATSPIAARQSVAAGYMATLSLRQCGQPMSIPPLASELAEYFERGQR